MPHEFLSPFRAASHIIKSIVGLGIFMLPHAFVSAGWLMGLFLSAVVGVILLDSLLLLVNIHCREQSVIESGTSLDERNWTSSREMMGKHSLCNSSPTEKEQSTVAEGSTTISRQQAEVAHHHLSRIEVEAPNGQQRDSDCRQSGQYTPKAVDSPYDVMGSNSREDGGEGGFPASPDSDMNSPTFVSGESDYNIRHSMFAILAGKWGGPVLGASVRVCLVVWQFCTCLICIQLGAGMVTEVARAGPASFTYVATVFILVVVFYPLTLLTRHLSKLAIVSILSVGLLTFVILACMINIFQYSNSSPAMEESVLTQNTTQRRHVAAVVSPLRWPSFVNTMVLSLGAIHTILPIHDSMHPLLHQGAYYKKVYALVFLGIFGLYLVFGLMGYLVFGSSLQTSVVSLMPESVWGDVVRVALAAMVFFTAPIHFVPAIQVLDAKIEEWKEEKAKREGRMGGERKMPHVWQDKHLCGIRGLLCLLLGLCAAVLGSDTVAVFVSFVGASTANYLGVIVPAIMRLRQIHHHPSAVNGSADDDDTIADHAGADANPYSMETGQGPSIVTPPPHLGPRGFFNFIGCEKAFNSLEPWKLWGYILFGLVMFVVGMTLCVMDVVEIVRNRK